MFAKIMGRLSKVLIGSQSSTSRLFCVQDVSQLELLRELLRLQKDMVIMLLGLLEGNEHSTIVGKQMVDTLEECSSFLEVERVSLVCRLHTSIFCRKFSSFLICLSG